MTFRQAVRTVLTRKYATFHGRAGRPEFWWFWLFATVLNLAVAAIPPLVTLLALQEATTPDWAVAADEAAVTDLAAAAMLLLVTVIAQGVLGLALALPTMAVFTRRLHDIGRSGWWQVLPAIPWAVPAALSVLSSETGDPSWDKYGPPASLVAVAGSILFLIILARPGDPGPNQYGQAPGAMEDAGRPSVAPSVHTADGPSVKQASRKPLVVALVLAVAVIIGLATERVIAEQNHQILVADMETDYADLQELQREQADIADAYPDDIAIHLQSPSGCGEGGSAIPCTVSSTSERTAAYMVEITIVDPDSRSRIYDSATIATTTLAPGKFERGELHVFTNCVDWPTDTEGRWSWDVASATGSAR